MKKLWIVLIVGIILRIFLSLSTFHPDIAALSAGGQFVTSGHILNLYDYSSNALVLNYPPLIYWLFGLFNFLFSGNVSLLKLSYLFFDISIAFLLSKIVDPKKTFLAFSLWIFNPVSLYSTYMMGQFDIIPTFFTILAIYLISKEKLSWAAIALGGGIAFKLYPIFLLIPLILLGKGIWVKIKLLILAGLPYIISILPYFPSAEFRSTALFANQSSKSLYANIPVSGGESILLFPAFLIIFYLYILRRTDKFPFWKLYLVPLMLFFIFTHYHPQWLIWVTPFLILDLVNEKFRNIIPTLILFGSWIVALFFFDPSLTVGMFAPLFPVLKNTPDIWTLLNLNLDYHFSRSILQTIFAAASIYLISFHILKKDA